MSALGRAWPEQSSSSWSPPSCRPSSWRVHAHQVPSVSSQLSVAFSTSPLPSSCKSGPADLHPTPQCGPDEGEGLGRWQPQPWTWTWLFPEPQVCTAGSYIHTYSCFLELVIQVFSLLLHRATLIGPRHCQTRSHTQEGHTSFLQTSSIGITTTCSDNPLTHTTQLAWTRNPHVGVQLPPSQATKTATVFSAHTPSSVIKFTSATISGSLVHRTCPLVGHVTSQKTIPVLSPQMTTPCPGT